MNKTQTTYRIIGFGEANYGFFNQFNFSSTLKGAEEDYQRLLEDPEMDGAVIIKVDHEEWQVINEFGTDGKSIECSPLGTFKIKNAPALVIL